MRVLLSIVVLALLVNSAIADDKPTLRLGAVASTKETTRKAIRNLRNYLAQDMNCVIDLKIYRRYGSIVKALLRGHVDVALLPPYLYLKARQGQKLRTLACTIFRSSGYFSYKSVLLVRRRSPMRSLKDLKGKRVAFVDNESASGYVIPQKAMEKAGVPLAALKKHSFAGNHVDGVLALLDGKADAAAAFDEITEVSSRLRSHKKKLRRLWTSKTIIPADVFVSTSDVPLETRKALRLSLICYAAAQRYGKTPKNPIYEGFVPGDPNLYDSMAALIDGKKGK